MCIPHLLYRVLLVPSGTKTHSLEVLLNLKMQRVCVLLHLLLEVRRLLRLNKTAILRNIRNNEPVLRLLGIIQRLDNLF